MSERVKRFFEQRQRAAEGTWTPPPKKLPEPEPQPGAEPQVLARTLYFAESIGLPARVDVLSSTKNPRRIERFFQRRRDAEEGVWTPLPEMMLAPSVTTPRTLAPVPRHGAPLLAQDEPEIAWNRPKPGRQGISFRLDDASPDESWESRMLLRVASVGAFVGGIALAFQANVIAAPLLGGGVLFFLLSFAREELLPQIAPLPKKPPQSAPFQLSWQTTRPVVQPGLEQPERGRRGFEPLDMEHLALEQLALEELDLCEAGSSHHESA